MRYHYTPKELYFVHYGETHLCDTPIYSRCTLYTIHGKGLAVIQQRYDPESKHTWWDEIDECLKDELYLSTGFYDYFLKYAREPRDDIYPTVTVRQIMWALKIKPMKREPWETVYDKCPIYS